MMNDIQDGIYGYFFLISCLQFAVRSWQPEVLLGTTVQVPWYKYHVDSSQVRYYGSR